MYQALYHHLFWGLMKWSWDWVRILLLVLITVIITVIIIIIIIIIIKELLSWTIRFADLVI